MLVAAFLIGFLWKSLQSLQSLSKSYKKIKTFSLLSVVQSQNKSLAAMALNILIT